MATAPTVCVRRAKLIFLMENAGKDVLTFVLKRGALNAPTAPPGVFMSDYLDHLPPHSSSNYAKMTNTKKNKVLTSTDRRQLQRFPLWDSFDITLLWKLIKLTSEGVAGMEDAEWQDPKKLEGLVTRIKEERNELFHEVKKFTEKEYQDKVNELEDIFFKVLGATKNKYHIPDADLTSAMDNVKQITDNFRKTGMEKDVLIDYFHDKVQEFIRDSESHLSAFYERLQVFDPLSFLTRSPEHNYHIQDIFCKMSLMKGRGHVQERKDFDACDVLTVTRRAGQNAQPSTSTSVTPLKHGSKPQLILIRGVAGSGKTTLLTFLLSEWLKDPIDCKVKHLHEYNIMLRVLCREGDGPALKDFLKKMLPKHFAVMEEHLVTCLEQCKVLLLIDGLDELAPGSRADSLVTDILNTAKYLPDFTLVCTLRPETVKHFLNKVPAGIEVWNMEMKSFSVDQRINFVMKYYEGFPDNGKKNPEKLQYLMKSLQWREYLGLPLNLLFIATLFYENLDIVNTTTTQTRLYFTIRDWCKEKLQARLINQPQDQTTLEDNISEVLDDMYDVALQALLEDRVSLSKMEVRRVRKSCDEKNLPSKELLPAFFNLRDIGEGLSHHQQYTAPHKSMQEFYGASGIVHKLVESPHSASIRHLLHDPALQQLQNLRNLLLHVTGLLCHPETLPCASAIQEVVDLLAETGIEDCNDWLSMLEDTEVNKTVLDCVVRYISSDEDEMVTITDSTITSAKALLPYIPSKEVVIALEREESDIQGLFFKHHNYTELWLHHHYMQPNQDSVSDSMLCATPRRNLERFLGHLSAAAIQCLQHCRRLSYLCLAVCEENIDEVLDAISDIEPSLRSLRRLTLHVPVGSLSTLPSTRLPAGPDLCLVLSGVHDGLLEHAVKISVLLQPTDQPYRAITFPGSRMTAGVWRDFLDKMAIPGIRVEGYIAAPKTSPLTDQDEQELSSLAQIRMLEHFTTLSEEDLWV